MGMAVVCDNCGMAFDPVRVRWRCPVCGWKDSCCTGEPQPAEDQSS